MSHPTSLAAWLRYLETLHPKAISLGLDRVRAVHDRLALAPACPVVTVTGTNGKGSTSAFIERMLSAGGYRVGLYTSPHLLRYNERVRIAGVEATDAELTAAFAAVEAVRQDIPLTYFEFGTLAALWLFARVQTDALVLEVGLRGRLDAGNIVDADVAVVTTIAIDHTDYLGLTREDIGREKAGIFRTGRLAVCADPDPPTALDALRAHLAVDMGAVRDALVSIELPGRFQVLPGRPVTVLDVAHNVQAARALADTVAAMGFHPQTLAVFGIMADKDVDAVIAALKPRVDQWLVATLPPPRGATAMLLRQRLEQAGIAPDAIRTFDDAGAAYRAAREIAAEADRIIVFGSFLTVAAALA